MATGERSITDVLQDIIGNVQDIVRSEVQLARNEALGELRKLRLAAPLLVVGGVASLLAALFFAWACVYGLGFVVALWAAALIVAGALTIIGGAAFLTGLKRLHQINPPERTIATMKENVQWAKQQVK